MHITTDMQKAKALSKAIGELFVNHQTDEIAAALAITLSSFTRAAKHATMNPEQQIAAIARLAATIVRQGDQ